MEKGSVSLDWFQSPLAERESPWELVTLEPSALGHRDACIGNGLIGTRINNWGDASGYAPGSGSFMSGLWGAATENPKRPQGMVELPHWATLSISGGDRELRRAEKTVSGHQQSLNLRNATVETSWEEENLESVLKVKRRSWAARGHRHIGVLELEGTKHPIEAGKLSSRIKRIFIDESLDALHIPDTENNETQEIDGDLCLKLTSRKFGHELVIRSRVLFECSEDLKVSETYSSCSHVVRRRFQLNPEYGVPFKVTKVVALVSSKQASDPEKAAKEFLDEACRDLGSVRKQHEHDWEGLWKGRIESDNVRFQQLANASLYYIYSTLREDLEESHGPCGLFGNGWDSNVFWDTELWTFPPIALLQPAMAKSCVAYRYNTLGGAQKNAQEYSENGARYAWQSGETGEEACSMYTFQEERHIVSCVALGQWLYLVASGDNEWLKREGLDVLKNCAAYWASKATYDESDKQWHILRVCGSDEHAGIVDDNATTNWGAIWTLKTASRLLREVGQEPPEAWEEIANGLVILWDEERGVPLQMKQWVHGQVIKQADTTMLIHPWHFPMDDETMKRTVEYYRSHYQSNPIMMGYAIDGIIDCRLGSQESVDKVFESMIGYYRLPYLLTSEAITNERLPFLTGMGGFLQLVLNGFCGLMADDSAKLKSAWACLPEKINWIKVRGVHHQGEQYVVETARGEKGPVTTTIESVN